MEGNPVAWFEICVKEMQRAKKFYENVFKISLQRLDNSEVEMWTFPMKEKASGAAGALAKMEGFEPTGNGVIIYFISEDCGVEEKRIKAEGGEVQKTKTSIGEYGFIVIAKDTEGNLIGIHSKQ